MFTYCRLKIRGFTCDGYIFGFAATISNVIACMDTSIDQLLLKLRNLQILLEEATLRGSHAKVKVLITEMQALEKAITANENNEPPVNAS
jgi:hypothetical protein